MCVIQDLEHLIFTPRQGFDFATSARLLPAMQHNPNNLLLVHLYISLTQSVVFLSNNSNNNHPEPVLPNKRLKHFSAVSLLTSVQTTKWKPWAAPCRPVSSSGGVAFPAHCLWSSTRPPTSSAFLWRNRWLKSSSNSQLTLHKRPPGKQV